MLIDAVGDAVVASETIPETAPANTPLLISNVLLLIAFAKVPVGAFVKAGTNIPLKVPAVFNPTALVILLLEME